jgi:aryl-alcohol dehydrogenase-like predicted oxidoreductase
MHVSALRLGTMMFGEIGNRDEADCARILHAALDAGINIVDTADMYSAGESEEIVGKALRGRRDHVILATKGHFPVDTEDRNRQGNSRRHLTAAVEDSLRRLQTDWIDLYQVHRPDPDTDIEETLATLHDLRAAGKIRAYGCSTFPADHLVDAWHTRVARSASRPSGPSSRATRCCSGTSSARCCPSASATAWVCVCVCVEPARGRLAERARQPRGAVDRDPAPPVDPGASVRPSARGARAKTRCGAKLGEVAREAGCTLPQVAIAFTQRHPAVTATILGPRTMEQLTSLLGCSELDLEDSVLDRIDEITARRLTCGGTARAWEIGDGRGAHRRLSRSRTLRCLHARQANTGGHHGVTRPEGGAPRRAQGKHDQATRCGA